MFYLSPNFDSAGVQAEMERTARKSAVTVPSMRVTSFADDLKALRFLYRDGQDFALAEEKFQNILKKWDSRFKPRGRGRLIQIIASMALSAQKFEKAQDYFAEAIAADPDNASIMIARAEAYMVEGDIAEARSWFRRAFFTKQNVHTAAKYAELLYLAGEREGMIKMIISPTLGDALTVEVPTRSEVTILTLNLLLQPDTHKIKDNFQFIQQRGQFNNPEAVREKILALSRLWSSVNRDEAMRWMASDRLKRGFGQEADENLLRPKGPMRKERLSEVAYKIIAAYRGANDIFNDPYERRPASRQAVRAAGGRGPSFS